tara:strand:- start:41 stop:1258 length:1218 start_codon:yes stop_codon:yes gene_type:complete
MSTNLQKRKYQFIEKAIKKHGYKYDYSKVEYKYAKENVIIICHNTYPWGEEHGEFLQTPDTHLRSRGCPKCSKVHRPTTSEWIKMAEWIHGKRYDYSKVVYKNNRIKICIICKEHDEFLQTPANHIKGGNCPKCSGHFMDKNFFVEKSKEIYKDENGIPLYDYSLVNYKDSSTHVTIKCPLHNYEFSKTPNKHLGGQGCPLCANESTGKKLRMSDSEFLKRARKEHGDKYDYLTKYVTAKTKILIKCKKCNYKWEQEAFSHLSGCGCPSCNESKLEKKVTKYLNQLDIRYIKQKKFKWLGRQSLDFYLTNYKLAIECQGIQHFESKEWFDRKRSFTERVKDDNKKLKKCLSNNIEMIYVVDNQKYFEKKYNFDIVEPFSGNVSYKMIHINNFTNFLSSLLFLGKF